MKILTLLTAHGAFFFGQSDTYSARNLECWLAGHAPMTECLSPRLPQPLNDSSSVGSNTKSERIFFDISRILSHDSSLSFDSSQTYLRNAIETQSGENMHQL